jgi:hypothetical protein
VSTEVVIDVETVARVRIRQFMFFMKAIAEDDLWDDVEVLLEERGYLELVISSEPIGVVQQMLQNKVKVGEPLSSRTRRVVDCGCGVSNPGPPKPVTPPSHGGGGDGGPPPPPPQTKD